MDNLILECRNWVIQNFKDFAQGDLKIPYVIKNPKNCGEIGTFIDNYFKVPKKYQTENTDVNPDGKGYELKSKGTTRELVHRMVQLSCSQSRGPQGYKLQKTIDKMKHTLALVKYFYDDIEKVINILSIELFFDADEEKLEESINRTNGTKSGKHPPNFMLSEGKLSDIYSKNLKII